MKLRKSRFAEKQLWLLQTGQYRVRRQVGELPFCVFDAGIIWRRDDSGYLWVLCGFGPNMGGFLVQKRNETPETPETLETSETLGVDVRNVVLSTFQRTWWQS